MSTTTADPTVPCGYCRRCLLHDDPAGCLTVEAWERENPEAAAASIAAAKGMEFVPYEQTNPRAHGNAPFALRPACGGRPEGSYENVAEAAAAAKYRCSIVTTDGSWIVARIEVAS